MYRRIHRWLNMTRSNVPKYIQQGLEKQDPETLREIANRATALANEKEAELEVELSEREVDDGELPEEIREQEPDEAPSKAGITIKTINDNRYYYYQWREGDQIKSEYIAPVDLQ